MEDEAEDTRCHGVVLLVGSLNRIEDDGLHPGAGILVVAASQAVGVHP